MIDHISKEQMEKCVSCLTFPHRSLKEAVMQKQPSRVVLRKKCSENMQQIYSRTLMAKCIFNKVAFSEGLFLVDGKKVSHGNRYEQGFPVSYHFFSFFFVIFSGLSSASNCL